MAETLRRLGRWLLTGQREPEPEPSVCDICERGFHVHDVNTGQCVTTWCRCSHG